MIFFNAKLLAEDTIQAPFFNSFLDGERAAEIEPTRCSN